MTQTRFISTVTGRQFHFANPTPAMVDPDEIAHSLGNLCRFTGHCRRFYSVAEHSWHVSYLVPPELALCGLLHDATEPYTNDLAKPLKDDLPDYQVVEARVWREAVAPRFGLPEVMPREIKLADMAMLKREVIDLFPPHVLDELGLPGEPADVGLRCWDPCRARYNFIQRYLELTTS